MNSGGGGQSYVKQIFIRHKNLLCKDKCLLEPVLVDLNQVVHMFLCTQGAAFLVSDWIEEKGKVLVCDA